MTDKQIIIDGVDVCECVYRAEEKCILKDDGCYFFPNCYYKQLKRKEQECEELKKQNDCNCLDSCCKKQQLDQLKAENEELIAKYNDCHYVTTNYHICFEGALGAIQELVKSEKTKEQVEYYTNVALNYLSMRYDERKKVPNKYKQTLTEIKEIAEDFGFNGTYESYKTAIDQILQKISECEVLNEV